MRKKNFDPQYPRTSKLYYATKDQHNKVLSQAEIFANFFIAKQL